MPRYLKPIHAGQLHVKQDDVRVDLIVLGNRRFTIDRLPRDFESLRFEQRPGRY